jgi:hypothetical protein
LKSENAPESLAAIVVCSKAGGSSTGNEFAVKKFNLN